MDNKDNYEICYFLSTSFLDAMVIKIHFIVLVRYKDEWHNTLNGYLVAFSKRKCNHLKRNGRILVSFVHKVCFLEQDGKITAVVQILY